MTSDAIRQSDELLTCFPAGTPVYTSDGDKPIEQVQRGDFVWSYDLAEGAWHLRPVLETFIHEFRGNSVLLTVDGETLEATDTHPFQVVEGTDLAARPVSEVHEVLPEQTAVPGRWVSAGDLRVGDRLLLHDGRTLPIEHLRLESLLDTVYNFHVDQQKTYAVGHHHILVHNTHTNNLTDIGTTAQREPLWTGTKNKTGVENAFGHFKKHGKEFPEFPNATQYAQGARNFVTNPPKRTFTKVRPNGDKLFYNPATNTFAVQRADGALRTMFRPADGINYWNKQ